MMTRKSPLKEAVLLLRKYAPAATTATEAAVVATPVVVTGAEGTPAAGTAIVEAMRSPPVGMPGARAVGPLGRATVTRRLTSQTNLLRINPRNSSSSSKNVRTSRRCSTRMRSGPR